MTSPDRIAAARANGAKSRGPKTPEGKRIAALNSAKSTGPVTIEGKARSSRNAVRYGLLADSMVLEGESEPRFCSMLALLRDELKPAPGIETQLVETLAVSHWRRMRLWSLEKAQYIQETRRRRAASNVDEADSPIMHLARSFRSLADQSRALDLLNRYETRFSRDYMRALNGIGDYRRRKIPNEVNPAPPDS